MEQMSDVFRYGSHTHALHQLDKNRGIALLVSQQQLSEDLRLSKNILGTTYFAYPFGHYDQRMIHTLKQTGYRMALSTRSGKVRLGDDLFTLKRLGINPGISMDEFAKKVRN